VCGSKKNKEDASEIYFRAKQTHNQFPVSKSNARDVFDLIHYNIWGLYSSCGTHYFLSIVDDTSRATQVYLMKDRTEGSKLQKGFIIMVKNQFHKA